MWKRNSNWRIFEKKNELNLTAIWNRTENDNNSTFTYIFLTSCKNSHYQFYVSYVLFITDSLELSTQEFDIGTPAINKIVHITHRDCGFIIICWAPIFMNFVIESTPRKSNVNRSKWITWQKVVLVKQLSTYLQILENENNSWTIKILMPRDFDELVVWWCIRSHLDSGELLSVGSLLFLQSLTQLSTNLEKTTQNTWTDSPIASNQWISDLK